MHSFVNLRAFNRYVTISIFSSFRLLHLLGGLLLGLALCNQLLLSLLLVLILDITFLVLLPLLFELPLRLQ